MSKLAHDFVFALRQLRKHRTYALTAILSMALGIGAAAAVYSVLYGVLIDPYPYRNANRIAFITVLWENQPNAGTRSFTLDQVARLKKEFHSVEDAIAEDDLSMVATDGDLPTSVKALEVSGNTLQFLGAPPLLGRIFTSAEAPPKQEPPPVAVISYPFWKSHFNGRSDVIGKTTELNHRKYTVIGVMGPRFTWTDSDVYLPIPASSDREKRFGTLIRLRRGVSLQAASEELQGFIQQDNQEHPKSFGVNGIKFRTKVETLNDWLLGRFKGVLFLLFAAVGLLLLIGCGNVSILMLARATARQQELAMRAALGASRLRILRQLLTEAVLLSLLGGALGVGLAFLGVRLITALLPEYSIPHEVAIAINPPVLAFSVVVSVLSGILFGISPALQFSRPQIAHLVQSAGSRTTTMRLLHTQAVLLIGQVALTILLLSAAGATMRNFFEAYTAKLGFNPHGVLLLNVMLPEGSYLTWESRTHYFDEILQRVQTTPGVLSASFGSATPPSENWTQTVDIVGEKPDPGWRTGLQLVSPGFFSTLQIPLLAGHIFNRAEFLRGAHLAVVNKTFAHRYFPGKSALGRHITPSELTQTWPNLLQAPGADQPLEIVGVVADVRNDGLHRPVIPQTYVLSPLLLPPDEHLYVRTAGDPARLTHPIAANLLALNPNQTVNRVIPLNDYLSQFVWSHERFASILFSVFSTVALGLATIGLFSVIAYSVEQRTREIGIRMALGAQRRHVLTITLAATLRTTAIGVALGIVATLLLSNTIYQWTDSSTRDATVLLLISTVFFAASLLACLLPAKRATSIDPMQTLRVE